MIRKRFLRKTLILAAAALCTMLFLQAPAQAELVDLRFVNVSPGSSFQVTLASLGTRNFGVGVYNLEIDGPETSGIFPGFCIEDAFAESTFNEYALLEITPELKPAVWIAEGFLGSNFGWSAEATQLAIWELLLETEADLDLAAGAVMSSSAPFNNEANSILALLAQEDLSSFSAANYRWAHSPIGSTNPAAPQDYIVRVPEPGSLMLIGFGLIGLAAVSRKKFLK